MALLREKHILNYSVQLKVTYPYPYGSLTKQGNLQKFFSILLILIMLIDTDYNSL